MFWLRGHEKVMCQLVHIELFQVLGLISFVSHKSDLRGVCYLMVPERLLSLDGLVSLCEVKSHEMGTCLPIAKLISHGESMKVCRF